MIIGLEGSNSTQGRALLRNPTLCHRIGERHKTAYQNNSNWLWWKEVEGLETHAKRKAIDDQYAKRDSCYSVVRHTWIFNEW